MRVARLGLEYDSIRQIIEDVQISRLLIFPVAGSSQEQTVLRILRDINPAALSLPGKTLVIDVEGYWKKTLP